ncbi:transcriptional regulator [Clostridium carboxidivorans P7]|uniref:Putative sigma54 specific transcriptional regulator n=1 Tax=Clostridium carboxidivorans P7 TaxID=536227 RepID=C6PWR5_9CLOT|nr:sigma 54-interacting transcriptional regulator [Clostridium carboxidivorans]AKN32002.1 transcriptional regulator [Clostridium carboxidivorans P7]EET86290.1 putative sigma54 specific transcriptional regulator [Clostridium carboxidivorans P7]EFG87861.1 arginine utilization regulatory protein RocR family protein [Clostridium carboxidivorans P7]
MEEFRGSSFNITLITPYEYMGELFKSITEKSNVKAHIEVASLNEAANIASKLQNKVDVFLSRGGTADYIKKAVDIPVVAIPVTAFDVLKSIHYAKEITSEVSVFTYGKTIFGIKNIEDILDVKIYEYIFKNEEDIDQAMNEIKSKGIKVVVGGMPAVLTAQKYGLRGVLVECGEEAIQQSLQEALHIAEVRKIEAARSARLKVILDSITQGVIVTNEHNKIVLYNPAAEKIFDLSSKKVLGKDAFETIPNTRMHNVLESGEAEIGVLQDINGGTIATNRIPIEVDGKRIGVVSTFEDITKIQQLEQKIRERIYKKGFVAKYFFEDILTANESMIELKKIADLYAKTDAEILIQGESGTGKELFAQSIHNASTRSNGPFVAVNCAAIPDNLLESELFGYEGGAFTGAKKEGKQGLFELAHNGTIFLDEIGEISKGLQARLLRVIQEKEIMRVGGDKVIPIDIRIVSATNQNLEKQIETGEFRQDLYYRLNVFNIILPPLRERKEDISLIANKLLKKFAENYDIDFNKVIKEINPLLIEYDWPGNIREFNNIIERLALVAVQTKSHNWAETLRKVMHTVEAMDEHIVVKVNLKNGLKDAVKEFEKYIINSMLLKYDQDKDKVIKELKIGRATFWRKI